MPAARIAASLVLLALLALAFWPASTSAGGIIYVDAGGTCGGESPCFDTIQEAVNNASPLTDVLVMPGTYAESVNLSDMGSAIGGGMGRIGLYAVDENGEFTPGMATIDPGAPGGPGAGAAIFNEAVFGGAIEIGGFIVDSPDTDGIHLKTGDDYIQIDATTADSVGDGAAVGSDSTTRGSGDDAFDLESSGGDIGVTNSVGSGATSPSGDGFDIRSSTGGIFISGATGEDNLGIEHSQAFDLFTSNGGPVVIENSTARGSDANGFFVTTEAGSEPAGNVMISGSLSEGNGSRGFDFQSAIDQGLGGAVTIIDSTARENTLDGFMFDDIDGPIEMSGLTARDNGMDGVLAVDTRGPVSIVDTMSSGNGGDGLDIDSFGGVSVEDTSVLDNAFQGLDISADGDVAVDGVTSTGNGTSNPFADGVEVRGTTGAPGTVRILNSLVADNAEAGVVLEGLTGNTHEVVTNVICGNPGVGLKLDGTGEVDAPANWWGDASGPTNASNPGGSGDAVESIGGNVLFFPWIETAIDEILPMPAGDVPAGQLAALRVRFVDADDTEMLGDGPGDSNGAAPFEISTDDGTLMSGGEEGGTVGGYLDGGFLNFSFVGDEEGIANITVTGPCGLSHEFEIGVSFGGLHGDVDCDGDVDSVDALKLLQKIAGLDPAQGIPCEAIEPPFADIDCDGDVDSVDALQILRHIAGLGTNQQQPCRAIGT